MQWDFPKKNPSRLLFAAKQTLSNNHWHWVIRLYVLHQCISVNLRYHDVTGRITQDRCVVGKMQPNAMDPLCIEWILKQHIC